MFAVYWNVMLQKYLAVAQTVGQLVTLGGELCYTVHSRACRIRINHNETMYLVYW